MEKVIEIISNLPINEKPLLSMVIILILSNITLVFVLIKFILKQTNIINIADRKIKESHEKIVASLEQEIKLLKEGPGSTEYNQKNINLITSFNKELREHISQIEIRQTSFEKNITRAIDAGLKDIKDRIKDVSLTELIEEIPPKFKSSIEKEISEAYLNSVQKLLFNLKAYDDSKESVMYRDSIELEIINIISKKITEKIKRDWIEVTHSWDEVLYDIAKNNNYSDDFIKNWRLMNTNDRYQLLMRFGIPIPIIKHIDYEDFDVIIKEFIVYLSKRAGIHESL